MTKTLFIFLFASTLSCSFVDQTFAQSQTWDWARSGIGADAENVNCVATDALGNVYVAGYYYSSTLTLGTFSLLNSGNYDLFVVKFDASGNVLWATSGGGIYDEVGMGIAVDLNQNVYVTGYSYSPILTLGSFSLTGAGAGDAFVIKYNSNGSEIWAKNIGGPGDENASAISCDPSGNIIITGFYQSSSLGFGNDTLINSGSDDVFIAKMNAAGNFIWSRSANGPGSDKGSAIASDLNGSVLVTGMFDGPSISVGPDSLFSSGSSDVFIIKFNSSGTLLWKKGGGGNFNDFGNSITADPNGNVFVTGTYNSPSLTISGQTLTNSGGFDFFILKCDAAGNLLWAKTQGGIFDDTGYGIASNFLGDVFVTGHFHSPTLILGTDTFSNEGIGDLYIAGYTGAGNLMWSKQLGGTSDDGSGSIAADGMGNLFVCGYYISPTLASPGFTLNNSGNEDLLLVKLKVEYDLTWFSDPEEPESIQVYPNPSLGKIEVSSKTTKITKITVYTELGRVDEGEADPQFKRIIDLYGKPPGMYFLKITTARETVIKKVILH